MTITRIQKIVMIAFSGMALLIVALCIHALLPPVAHSKLVRLTPGTPRTEVERILGRPAEVLIPSAFGAEAWRYQVSLRFGWVDIFLDDQGRVIGHNYETF